jgi:hypothetical protein
MTLLVKDADTTTRPIATQTDSAGNLVPVHVSALAVNGIAIPIGPSNPLPVAQGGSIASDGSGAIANGGTPQASRQPLRRHDRPNLRRAAVVTLLLA